MAVTWAKAEVEEARLAVEDERSAKETVRAELAEQDAAPRRRIRRSRA